MKKMTFIGAKVDDDNNVRVAFEGLEIPLAGVFPEARKRMDCRTIEVTCVKLLDQWVDVLSDEEGLFVAPNSGVEDHILAFSILDDNGHLHPIPGNILLAGSDEEGDWSDCPLKSEEILWLLKTQRIKVVILPCDF